MKTRPDKRSIARFAYLAMSVLFVLLILAVSTPQPASAARCKFKYKVKPGDTLISIADLFQTDWREIADASNLKEPYVLQVGQVLCIPSGVAPADVDSVEADSPASSKAKITAEASFMDVVVVVENFPPLHVYYVKIGKINGPPPRTYPLTLIGRLKTDKKGYFSGFFPLPMDFPQTEDITLCLKDPWTDKLYCIDYDNPYHAVGKIINRCYKTGR